MGGMEKISDINGGIGYIGGVGGSSRGNRLDIGLGRNGGVYEYIESLSQEGQEQKDKKDLEKTEKVGEWKKTEFYCWVEEFILILPWFLISASSKLAAGSS